MNVLIFGATGMVGQGVLRECLNDPAVVKVLSVGRTPLEQQHPKLQQLIHTDFTDFMPVVDQLRGFDACFFCLGVSSAGMKEADYRRVTYDFTVAAAKALREASPQATFVYVSGERTDSTEQGSSMWARVKGQTENAILKMGFKDAYMFRPGAIIAGEGIRPKSRVYRVGYALMGWTLPALRAVAPNIVTSTEEVGRAMLKVARDGSPEKIVPTKAIRQLGGASVG